MDIKLYTVAEAAEALNVARPTIRAWVNKKLLSCYRLSTGERLFTEKDLLNRKKAIEKEQKNNGKRAIVN